MGEMDQVCKAFRSFSKLSRQVLICSFIKMLFNCMSISHCTTSVLQIHKHIFLKDIGAFVIAADKENCKIVASAVLTNRNPGFGVLQLAR